MINRKTFSAFGPALLATISVSIAALAFDMVVNLARPVPNVGDIVAFPASMIGPPQEVTRLPVHKPDQFRCVLDLDVLHHSGGSLIVETRLNTDADDYRVHWAGVRTSDDPENCGNDADLILDRLDLEMLASAAGGFGTGPRPVSSVFYSDTDTAN